MPIVSWSVDPDFEGREHRMLTMPVQFRGASYAPRGNPHWGPIDKKMIRQPAKLIAGFQRISQPITIYCWQSEEQDYDPFLQAGMVDLDWIECRMGRIYRRQFEALPWQSSINIILTNNLSDERYIPLVSSWMLAHRISHALIGGNHNSELNHRVMGTFNRFVWDVMRHGYGYHWQAKPEDEGVNVFYDEEIGALRLELGRHLGSMKSARTRTLNTGWEWVYETFAEYLITGKVRFRPLPEDLDGYHKLTRQPARRFQALRLWERFPRRITGMFDRVMVDAVGKFWVI